MDTALSALHFYQPLLDRASPNFTLSEHLRVLRHSITVYESVLGGIRRRMTAITKNNTVEQKELNEKAEWYTRTWKALKENENDIIKALGEMGGAGGGVGR